MATSSLALGYASTIELDTGSNDGTFSSSATLGGFTGGTLTLNRANPDSSSIDTGGYKGTEYGVKSATLSAENNQDELNDTAQGQLLDDYDAGTKRWLRVRPRVGTGYDEWEIKFVLDSVTVNVTHGDLVKFTLAASSDGTITKQAQS